MSGTDFGTDVSGTNASTDANTDDSSINAATDPRTVASSIDAGTRTGADSGTDSSSIGAGIPDASIPDVRTVSITGASTDVLGDASTNDDAITRGPVIPGTPARAETVTRVSPVSDWVVPGTG